MVPFGWELLELMLRLLELDMVKRGVNTSRNESLRILDRWDARKPNSRNCPGFLEKEPR